ncbi:DUF1800 domain-containing protein [Ramlibacter sp. H39-3-26]|uniref:DUF1800 domain-containing protein n=1 Tax=Curvibacter soli TaxID=3031331 RepID=UPI0023DCE961|nr:DUF1800 domain-containing protein [Ramlibacter sp. H39-3-26]MDF1486293.1 DUF1800 domain-containing protein [Ramlibacter sp. H39-3-26]
MTPAAIALNRFGLGARPDEPVPDDPRGWLLQQIAAPGEPPPMWRGLPGTEALVAEEAASRRALREAAEADRPALRQARNQQTRDIYQNAVRARADSALAAAAPLVERLVHFWANHFALSIEKPEVQALAGAYEAEAIRPRVLGRFENLLLAAERHPAMLLYLDQHASVGPGSPAMRRSAHPRGLNENLAREIMELHTLGVRSGYMQEDVTEFARALTGWGAAINADTRYQQAGPDPGFVFRPQLHEPGARTVLGRRYEDQGAQQAAAVLHDLATMPATAAHLCAKLARHFVADAPPPALVERMTGVWLRTRGDLAAVTRALVESPEAWAPAPAKFKTPWEWAVSAQRALGRRQSGAPSAAAALFTQLGQPVWRPGSPAGWDDIAASWAAPDALVRRVETAQRLAAQTDAALDARALAPRVLPGSVADETTQALSRAESPATALALLLVAPDFLRR